MCPTVLPNLVGVVASKLITIHYKMKMYAVWYVVVWIVTDILWDLFAKLTPPD